MPPRSKKYGFMLYGKTVEAPEEKNETEDSAPEPVERDITFTRSRIAQSVQPFAVEDVLALTADGLWGKVVEIQHDVDLACSVHADLQPEAEDGGISEDEIQALLGEGWKVWAPGTDAELLDEFIEEEVDAADEVEVEVETEEEATEAAVVVESDPAVEEELVAATEEPDWDVQP